MKKILVISVHPDDETLGCGGTILKHIAENDEVNCVFVTSGNSSQIDTIPLLNKLYSFNEIVSLDLPENELQDLSLNILIPKFADIINRIKPEVLYIPNRSDVHSDHRAVFEALMACTKSFRFPFIEKVLMCEVISETDFAPPLIENVFAPNYFVDITKYLNKKLEILELFKSELLPYPQTRNLSTMKALNRYRGSQVNCEFAESYMLLKQIVR